MKVLFMKAHNPGYTYQRGGKTVVVAPFHDKRPAAKTAMKRSLVGRREDPHTGDLYDHLPDRARGRGTEAGRVAAVFSLDGKQLEYCRFDKGPDCVDGLKAPDAEIRLRDDQCG